MPTKKRWRASAWPGLTMILILTLALGACSGSNSAEPPPQSQTSDPGSSAGSSSAPESSAGSQGTEGAPATAQGQVIVVAPANREKPGNRKTIDLVAELSGVKVEPVYAAEPIDTFNLMLASGEAVDGVKVNLNQMNSLIARNSIMPLDDLIEQYGSANLQAKLNEITPGIYDWVKGPDGKTYGIPSASNAVRHMVNIRSDWLAALNLQAPTTIAEFESAMLAFKENAAKLRGTDEELYPLFIHSTFTDMALLGSFLPEGSSWWKDETGIWLPPEMHPEYKEYLRTLQTWYAKKIVHPETFLTTSGFLNEFGPRNMIGANIGWGTAHIFADYAKTKQEIPELGFETLELAGKYALGYPLMNEPGSAFVISARSQNPEAMISFLDWSIANKANFTITRRGSPDLNFKTIDAAEENYTIELLQTAPEDEFGTALLNFIDLPLSRIEKINNDARLDAYISLAKREATLKTYPQLDQTLALNPNTLAAMGTFGNDITTAREEKFIRIVTGEDRVESWDSFIEQWKKIGMDQVIAEKNEIYKAKGQ